MKEFYYYTFYILNNLFKSSFDSYNELKAVLILLIVQGLIIQKTISIVYEGFGIVLSYGNIQIQALIICLLLSAYNYYIFIVKREWQSYEGDFSKLTLRQKLVYAFFLILFAVLSFWYCFMY